MSKPYTKDFEGYAKVYTLSDENGNIFYVGCTVQPIEKRLVMHLSEARSSRAGNMRKHEIIRSLNYSVVITVLDMKWVTAKKPSWAHAQTKTWEHEWVLKIHALGYDLCNRVVNKKSFRSKKEAKPEFVGQAFVSKPISDKVIQVLERESKEKEAQDMSLTQIVQVESK